MDAEDLVAAVFPDQLACPENLVGDREIPDHPLVNQTIADCLLEAMDFPGLKRVLEAIASGQVALVARDTTEPSPLAHEVINAKPYAFLDDAPLEERRTQAVITRRGLDVKTADELGRLDQAAIDRVRDEAWPEVGSADELHDALMVAGAVPIADCGLRNVDWQEAFNELVRAKRAATLLREPRLWVAAERVPMLEAAFPGALTEPALSVPARDRAKAWTREDALRELVRGRLEVVGPTTAAAIGSALGVPVPDVDFALGALEHEGFVLRGRFTPGSVELEWCERRLLARIHRYTLDRLRQEIEPVAPADFMRFLLRWQRAASDTRAEGPEGLAAVLDQLDGYEVAAGAWESDVLPARLGEYDPLWLDGLCLSGEIAWGRLSPAAPSNGHKSGPIRTTPVALFRRERGAVWRSLAVHPDPADLPLSHPARALSDALGERGASFFGDLVRPACCARRWRRGSASWSPGDSSPPTASPGCARCWCPPTAGVRSEDSGGGARSHRSASRLPDAGRAFEPRRLCRRTRSPRPSRGSCCDATAWYSGGWSRARRCSRRGATFSECTGGSKRAARSAVGAS